MAQGKRICLQYRRCRRRGFDPGFDPWVEKIPWRRAWQPTPAFLPGKSHEQRSLAGYSPWGRKRVRHDLATKPPPPIGIPRWNSGKESTYHCKRQKRHGFDPWVGKILWRRKWQPTPVFLPGESQRRRSLVGYSPGGSQRVRYD